MLAELRKYLLLAEFLTGFTLVLCHTFPEASAS